MRKFAKLDEPEIIASLKTGGIGVIPTDTLYGIVARAADQTAVERVYKVRGRAPEKPCIVLVSDLTQIPDKTAWTRAHYDLAARYWPGPLSLVAPITETPTYLHRGTGSLAYRVPENGELRKLLSATGPLIAPSANLEGEPPATTIEQAKAYFGDAVDFYVDYGELKNEPSTLVSVEAGQPKVLRQGALKVY
ncbi:MAG: L-threonylcarbamoyladenylate synthase [Candidatus Saccharimonadales bacterium]